MTESSSQRRRVAGVTIPLFSLRSATDWGVGEISALPDFGRWVAKAGIRLVQLLPLGEIPGGETSPYSALSAFGIDPLYISIADLPDLPESVWPEVLGTEGMETLRRARASQRVDYAAVRALKTRALKAAYVRFRDHDLDKITRRCTAFEAFCTQNLAWLEDYALFRALRDHHEGRAWWDWSPGLRQRSAVALAEARMAHAEGLYFHFYVQWIAHEQWARARHALKEMGVEIMGDLPFMVGRDSADVWAHQHDFRSDAYVGAPPDQFNAEGQDWGLPPYDWKAMTQNGFQWLRRRIAYNGMLYDRFRIDHLVGFFRTYMRSTARLRDERGRLVAGYFEPADEPAQKVHGERVLTAMLEAARDAGAGIIAEDLGVIPDYVRPILLRLGIPGYKVLIWEKDYHAPGHPFLDPKSYPVTSVACCGTHDTDPMAVWWESRDAAERTAVQRIPGLSGDGHALPAAFTPEVHSVLLRVLLGASSELALLLMQDILGTRDRINVPATVGPHNWTWRLADTPEKLAQDPEIAAAFARVREAVTAGGRDV